MNSGPSLGVSRTRCGSGWRWSARRAVLLASPSATARRRPAESCGNRCQPTIASEPCATATSGRRTVGSCRPLGTGRSARTVARPRWSSASTTHCGSAAPIWFVRPCPSARILSCTRCAFASSLITETRNSASSTRPSSVRNKPLPTREWAKLARRAKKPENVAFPRCQSASTPIADAARRRSF